MRLLIPLVALSIAVTSCNSAQQNTAKSSPVPPAPPVATVSADGVRRIKPVELKDLLSKQQAIVVDVRTEGSYQMGHIPGAKLIPNTQILTRLSELPRNKLIVTYCS